MLEYIPNDKYPRGQVVHQLEVCSSISLEYNEEPVVCPKAIICFSIVLIALDDKLMWVDIGSTSDCNESEMKECIQNDGIGFPQPESLPFDDRKTLYFILGDNSITQL
jgi:hypothetical protein